MNGLFLGILHGLAYGLIDVAMTVSGNHPERNASTLLHPFFSRFASGLLAANVNLRVNPILTGVLVACSSACPMRLP